MVEIILPSIFILIVGVFSIPIYHLTKQYNSTRIIDFLYLDLFFVFILISTLFEIILQINQSLLVFQLRLGIHNIGWIFLLLHTQRTRKLKRLGKQWYFGFILFFIIQIMIILWKPMTQPDSVEIFGLTGYPSESLIFPDGAGIWIFDVFLFSSDFRYLAEIFWIYVSFVLIYTYSRVDFALETERTKFARKLWIVSFILFLIYFIPSTFSLYHIIIPPVPVILSLIFIAYLTIKYPESMLLSSQTVQRIADLQELVLTLKVGSDDQDHLLWYLERVKIEKQKSERSI